MVRRHPRRLIASASLLLACGLSGCQDDTPGALDSDAADYAAASDVWSDPWVASTVATVAGPMLGSNGLVDRVAGRRTTAYDASIEEVAAAELSIAADAGWSPTSSDCGDAVEVALVGPADAVATLVVTRVGASAEAEVTAATPHHTDEDWAVPEAAPQTCLDGGSGDYAEPPIASEPIRSSALPRREGTTWQRDEPSSRDADLLAEVNADLTARDLHEVPPVDLETGENRRRGPATDVSVEASSLRELGQTLEGWVPTYTACGADGPTRATYVGTFEHGVAVAAASLVDGVGTVRFTLPVVEGPPSDVGELAPLDGSPCLTAAVDALTVRGTPAVLPSELTPLAE